MINDIIYFDFFFICLAEETAAADENETTNGDGLNDTTMSGTEETEVVAKKPANNTETSIYVKNTGKNKKQKVEVAMPERAKKTVKPMSEKKKARNLDIKDKKKYFKVKPASKKKATAKKGSKKGPKKSNKK